MEKTISGGTKARVILFHTDSLLLLVNTELIAELLSCARRRFLAKT